MEKLEDAPKYQLWLKQLKAHGLQIHGVEEVHTRRRYNGDILFATLLLDATTPEGFKIPPICFLKGEVVTVLVCLIDQDTSEKYLLLVKQRRIADGALSYEHPAGMVDDIKTPFEIALQEVQEETGIALEPSQIKPLLHQKRLFPSTGTSDECMYFFYAEISLPYAKIMSYDSQNRGAEYENEHITTVVLPFKEAHHRLNNTNCLLLNLAYLKEVEDWDLLKKL